MHHRPTHLPPPCPQAVFLLIGKTSALTMNIAGVIKDWMLIFFSFYVFKAPVTALNLFGYAFCCSGVAIYNWQKLQQLKKKALQKAKEGGSADDKEAAAAGGGAAKPLLANGGSGGSNGAVAAGVGGKSEGSKE